MNLLFQIYIISIMIIMVYYYQFNFELKYVLKRSLSEEILNIKIIESDVKYIINNLNTAKFDLYPVMWFLISIAIIYTLIYHKQMIIFDVIVGILFIQNFIHYNFLIKIALQSIKENKSIEEVLIEKETKKKYKQYKEFKSEKEIYLFLEENNFIEINKILFQKEDKLYEIIQEDNIILYEVEEKETLYFQIYYQYINLLNKYLLHMLESFIVSILFFISLIKI